MPKEKKPSKDEKPQSERFIEAAKELGASDKKDAFEWAFIKVATSDKRPKEVGE